ncbi:hypothetical protein ACIBEA_13235 [Streptomyces sp. NPDC051555]
MNMSDVGNAYFLYSVIAGFDRIADDLAEFLDLPRRSVHRFDESGQPGFV